jgi:predicted Zn-dependent peptidase
MKPSQAKNVADLVMEEIQKVTTQGVNRDEFETAREQLKGNYILSLESSGSRMNAIGRSELLLGILRTPEEILEKIDNTTIDDVIRAACSILDPNRRAVAVVGCENVLEGCCIQN